MAAWSGSPRWSLLLFSRLDENLERGALVHRPVAVGGVLEGHGAVEDPAGLDPALQDVGQQLLDVGALRTRAAGERDVAAEQVEPSRRLDRKSTRLNSSHVE